MKPTLLIMAAGMGSRYGTLKQIDRIGPSGETIIDYSVYDAIQSRFGKVVFIIRKEFEKDFRDIIVKNIESHIEVELVFQELDNMPFDADVHPERKKPWGTGHAIWVAHEKIKEPFSVINADDFYGRDAFVKAAGFLTNEDSTDTFCLVGYQLKNTLSDYGFVSRGECSIDDDRFLKNVIERKEVVRTDGTIHYKDEEGKLHTLNDNTIVSMNMWGFNPVLFDYLKEYFIPFIQENTNNIKAEFLIPSVINDLMHKGKIRVKVLESKGEWFGMTYKEDKTQVKNKLNKLIEDGVYPSSLWG